MANRVIIPKERYLWAIERAGMTLNNYVCQHPKSVIAKWLVGEKLPTFAQLESFAKSVNVPIGFLLLDEAPKEEIPIPVFRGEAGKVNGFDLNVYDTICAIRQRQEWLEDYLQENEIETCKYVGCASLSTPINQTVALLRRMLGLDARWAFGMTSPEIAVSKMTEALEAAGVFIAYNGVVGNNTRRKLDVEECRGFALANKTAPYIFVNSGDAPTAQLFTLVHEAAHLLVGISAGHAAADTLPNEREERYCDSVAAEFLVPATDLAEVWNGDIKNAAHKFCVSSIVIARRAYDLHLITDAEYKVFWDEYKSRPLIERKKKAGGNFYRTSVKRVGRTFAIHIKNAVRSRQLSYTDAFRLTGLHGRTYTNFMSNNI